jgi:hypothetical protein
MRTRGERGLENMVFRGALLKPQFENIIRKNIENKIFDIEELKISKESKYYKNIDFEKILS